MKANQICDSGGRRVIHPICPISSHTQAQKMSDQKGEVNINFLNVKKEILSAFKQISRIDSRTRVEERRKKFIGMGEILE